MRRSSDDKDKNRKRTPARPEYAYKTIASPIGQLKLVGSDDGLVAILWKDDDPSRVRISASKRDDDHPILLETERQLNEYFAGTRKAFSVKLDFVGTDFQKSVWKAMMRIPFGKTKSYAELAKQIGSSNAARAVGSANRRNPISIIGPCHRVIGANGKLTGYAGGLWAKEYLLSWKAVTGHDARRASLSCDIRWDRLVPGTPWLDKFRALFDDEQLDYASALRRNYEQGPPANWGRRAPFLRLVEPNEQPLLRLTVGEVDQDNQKGRRPKYMHFLSPP